MRRGSEGLRISTVTYLNGGWGEFTRAVLLNCVGSGVNKPKHDLPNVMAQTEGPDPDDAELRAMLVPLRELRINLPAPRAEGVTDVRLLRVIVRASQKQTGMILRR